MRAASFRRPVPDSSAAAPRLPPMLISSASAGPRASGPIPAENSRSVAATRTPRMRPKPPISGPSSAQCNATSSRSGGTARGWPSARRTSCDGSPLGQRWPATKRREQPPAAPGEPSATQQLLRAAQAVPLQHDRVDPAGPQPAPHHASQQAARIQLVIADDVRNHIMHPPLRAQRRRLPLPRRQGSEKRREIRSLVPRQATHVHRKQANARSHTQAGVRPRTTPMPSADNHRSYRQAAPR